MRRNSGIEHSTSKATSSQESLLAYIDKRIGELEKERQDLLALQGKLKREEAFLQNRVTQCESQGT